MPQDYWVAVDSGTINLGTVSISGTATVEKIFSYFNTASNGTSVVKSGAGLLHVLNINNKSVLGQSILYDNTAASGTKMATVDTTLSGGHLLYDVKFINGLTVVNSGGGI